MADLWMAAAMARTIFGGDHIALVAVLIEARKTLGISQTELAARLGRRQPHVSLIEMGQRRVDVIEFIRLARALEREPSELIIKLEQRVAEPSGL